MHIYLLAIHTCQPVHNFPPQRIVTQDYNLMMALMLLQCAIQH